MTAIFSIPERIQLPPESRWDQTKIFASNSEWTYHYENVEQELRRAKDLRSDTVLSLDSLLVRLELESSILRTLELVIQYASNDVISDGSNSTHVSHFALAEALAAKVEVGLQFIEWEILAIPETQLTTWLSDERLTSFCGRIERVLRKRPHMLSPESARVVVDARAIMEAAAATYDTLIRSDSQFGTIVLPNGTSVTVSRGNYVMLTTSYPREIREAAFVAYSKPFREHRNTLASLLVTAMRKDTFIARATHFSSALEARLFDENVPLTVFTNLIEAVNSRMGAAHRYVELRRQCLKVEHCRTFDMRMELLKIPEIHIPYEKGVRILQAALRPFGEHYWDQLHTRLTGGFTDYGRNRGKRHGGSSGASYLAGPFISLDFCNNPDSLWVMAHESGHAMHQLLGAQNNPFCAYESPLLAAEVASTVNEFLLCVYLRSGAEGEVMAQLGLLNELRLFSSNLFAQTRLSEFEYLLHARVDCDEIPTSETIEAIFGELTARYQGAAYCVLPDDTVDVYVVQHFYRSFYTYSYATGVAAASALVRPLIKGDVKARDAYLRFLSRGGSAAPLELLLGAGVDMLSPQPVHQAIETFEERISELERILSASSARSVVSR